MTDEQKAEVIQFFKDHREQERNIDDKLWSNPKLLTYEIFKQVIDAFNTRKTKSKANKIANKKGISGIEEGIDYKFLGEFTDSLLGTFRAYVPLSWLGAKTIESSKVKPINADKDSAGWCIGWSEGDSHWKKYFAHDESDFLILCGEGIPSKKICIEILKEYEPINDISSLDYNYNLKLWNYYDYERGLSYLFTLDGAVSSDRGDIDTTKELIFSLINQAKEITEKRKEVLRSEAGKSIVFLKSDYIDKLTSFRNSEKFDEYLALGYKLLSSLDAYYSGIKQLNNSINILAYDLNNLRKSTTIDSLVSWYNENKDTLISNTKFVPYLIATASGLSFTDYSALKIVSKGTSAGASIDSDCHMYIRDCSIFNEFIFLNPPTGSNPYGNGKPIRNFNIKEILKVSDLVAFLGKAFEEKERVLGLETHVGYGFDKDRGTNSKLLKIVSLLDVLQQNMRNYGRKDATKLESIQSLLESAVSRYSLNVNIKDIMNYINYNILDDYFSSSGRFNCQYNDDRIYNEYSIYNLGDKQDFPNLSIYTKGITQLIKVLETISRDEMNIIREKKNKFTEYVNSARKEVITLNDSVNFKNEDITLIQMGTRKEGIVMGSETLLSLEVPFSVPYVGERFENGCPNWGCSLLRQWLNSDAPEGKWFKPEELYYITPYGKKVVYNIDWKRDRLGSIGCFIRNTAGFLSIINIPKSKLAEVENVTYNINISSLQGDRKLEKVVTKDYVWIPSLSELNIKTDVQENPPLDYWKLRVDALDFSESSQLLNKERIMDYPQHKNRNIYNTVGSTYFTRSSTDTTLYYVDPNGRVGRSYPPISSSNIPILMCFKK